MKGGLEKTLFNRFCMSQRLHHLLQEDTIPTRLKTLVEAFDKHFCHGKRGTLLNDISSFCSSYGTSKSKNVGSQQDKLQEPFMSLLKNHIEDKLQRKVTEIRDRAIFCKSFAIRGVSYHRYKHSFKDCHVIVGDIRKHWSAYRIEDIFTHSSNPNECDTTTTTYFVLRKYKELNQADSASDIYQDFPVVGGRLFYDEFEDKLELIEAANIICHFALTPFSKNDVNTGKDCIHVLPLDRVRSTLNFFDRVLFYLIITWAGLRFSTHTCMGALTTGKTFINRSIF